MNRLGALLLALAGSAGAADLQECTRIDDDIVRLFCYDRAAGRPIPAAKNTPPVAGPTETDADAAESPGSGNAFGPAEVEAHLEVELPSTGQATAAEKPVRKTESRIAGRFSGWSRGTRFTLENGEVWEAVGAGTHYSTAESPTVVIQRDLLGQYLMQVEGVKSKALVRRVDE